MARTEVEQRSASRFGRPGRDTTVYASLFLVFTGFIVAQAWWAGPLSGWGMTLTVLLFSIWYVVGYLADERPPPRGVVWMEPWPWLAGLVVLVAVGAMLTPGGLMLLTYVAAGAASRLPSRPAMVVIVGSGLAYGVVGALLGIPREWSIGLGLWVTFIGVSVWLNVLLGRNADALLAAREEKAALAVDLERERLARDLHDILGHSLTVVTIKAELAGRLVEVDPVRAKAEIGDVERLARDALTDVRATVGSYRSPSLPAELAGARRALEAAGIDAELPGAVDDVEAELREVFAWVVREGVTNVVRHSGASVASVRLSATSVEVRDDGRRARGAHQPGNGLVGLAERARQVGARLEVRRGDDGQGTILRVEKDS